MSALSVSLDARRLQRYILGLALVAFTRLPGGYIRQGTLLVSDTRDGMGRQSNEVFPDGRRVPFAVTHEQALAFAKDAAKAFGVGENRNVVFDAKLAETDLKEAKKEGKGGKKSKGKKADAANIVIRLTSKRIGEKLSEEIALRISTLPLSVSGILIEKLC